MTQSASSEEPGPDDIRVMVVDDSLVVRGLITRMIKASSGMYVVASVGDGLRAVEELKKRDIDVIVLDIEMPVMDGLTALPELLKVNSTVKIIMASTLTVANAEASLKALSLGATDYLAKPTASQDISGVGGSDAFRHDLIEKIKVLGAVARRGAAQRPQASPAGATRPSAVPSAAKPQIYSQAVTLRAPKKWVRRPSILAVGSSTGGPQALMSFFAGLTPAMGIPIVVTQHMPPKFTTTLADHISRKTGFPCVEGADGMALVAGRILLAPGDYHMEVVGAPGAAKIKLNQNPPENYCRPAVDPMFRSLVPVFGERVLAVVLTGMGHDGRNGAEAVVRAGGEVLAQDEASSTVWGMPGAVATAGLCSAVLPLKDLPAHVNGIVSKALP